MGLVARIWVVKNRRLVICVKHPDFSPVPAAKPYSIFLTGKIIFLSDSEAESPFIRNCLGKHVTE